MWYGTRDVARLLGLSEDRVRSYVRAGLVDAVRGPRNSYRFSFQDLVLLRAARALVDARVPHPRVVRALRTLKAQLPSDRSLSALRIAVEGDQVVVSDGGVPWNPESGQFQLEFSVAELEADVAPLHVRAERRPGEPTVEELFARGVELELVAPDDARALYERVLELDPRHPDAHVNLGRMLHETRRLAEAELHYRAALTNGPHATAAYNLGVVLEDRRRPKDAVAAYGVALEADARFADAHYNLSRLYEQLGDKTSALRHLKSYRALTHGGGGRA